MASADEFRSLTPEAAAERFAQFLSERSTALAALEVRASAAGLILDRSVESLGPLWEWIAPQLRARDRFERRRNDPSWLIKGHPSNDLDAGSVALLDGFVSYLGEVFAEGTGLEWELSMDPFPGVFQQPVFDNAAFVPINALNAALRRLADISGVDEQIMYWVGASIANCSARASKAVDPNAHALEIGVEASDLPGWDWEVWIDEAAEMELGSEAFDSLERGFSTIPHVTAVAHEDREIYLIRTERITREDLESALRQAVERALPR